MMEIKIEKLTEADLDDVIELALKTPELWDTDKPEYLSKNLLRNLIEGGNDICLKATVDGEFAGFRIALFHPVMKEAYLMDIAVHDKFRGLGIATEFYKVTEKIIKEKGGDFAWALVYEKNDKMMKFIEGKGYKKGRKWFTYFKEI